MPDKTHFDVRSIHHPGVGDDYYDPEFFYGNSKASILDNVMRTNGIRLVAVYSRSEEKGRALASEYGVEPSRKAAGIRFPGD